MELIQPFINAADAVLAETLQGPARMLDVNMEEEAYRRKGIAATVQISGEIEGRAIFDADPNTACAIASALGGTPITPAEDLVKETMFELANLVVGNAVTQLNDQGFQFRVHPPQLHVAEEGASTSEDTEALVMCFATPQGNVFMNIAMRYNRRRKYERQLAAH